MNREDEAANRLARTTGGDPRRAAPRSVPAAPAAPAPDTLLLRIHRSKEDPETFVLDPRRSYALGRSETADLRFDDDRVSRHHATLKFDGSWRIVDALSSNGTLVCRADDFRHTFGTDDDNIERASQRLGIARRTLMKKMDDFGIARPGRKPETRRPHEGNDDES